MVFYTKTIIYNTSIYTTDGRPAGVYNVYVGAALGQPLHSDVCRLNIAGATQFTSYLTYTYLAIGTRPRNLMDGENRSVCRIAGAVVAAAVVWQIAIAIKLLYVIISASTPPMMTVGRIKKPAAAAVVLRRVFPGAEVTHPPPQLLHNNTHTRG